MNLKEIQKSKVIIYSHYATTGATEELRDWLNKNEAGELVYIAFPFGNTKEKFISTEIFKKGKLIRRKKSLLRFSKPEPVSYIKDFIYGIFYGIKYGGKTDVFIGGDNLLSIIGLLLKKLRLLKKVIYYMIDYTPVRYANPLLNSLYYSLDKSASYNSDYVWPLNDSIIKARFNAGRLNPARVKWYVVPYGNHSSVQPGTLEYNKNRIVYMGDINKSKGAELFIPIAEELIKNKSDFKFIIIGGGKYLEEIKSEILEKNLQSCFEIHGYVRDFREIIKILYRCGIGIAPYYPDDPNNFTFYSDPGKIKTYLGCGLPIVLTNVPPIATAIINNKAGLITEYSAKDFAGKISLIINDYNSFRTKAVEMGKQFDWNRIFLEAFIKII